MQLYIFPHKLHASLLAGITLLQHSPHHIIHTRPPEVATKVLGNSMCPCMTQHHMPLLREFNPQVWGGMDNQRPRFSICKPLFSS